MSTEKNDKVSIVETRLNDLRHKMRISWGELANQLEISRAMLTYLRTEKRGISQSLEKKIAQLESSYTNEVTKIETDGNQLQHNDECELKNQRIAELENALEKAYVRERDLLEIIKNLSRNGVDK